MKQRENGVMTNNYENLFIVHVSHRKLSTRLKDQVSSFLVVEEIEIYAFSFNSFKI